MKLGVKLLFGLVLSYGVTKATTHTVSLTASGSAWNPTTVGSFSWAVDQAAAGDTIIFDYGTLGNSPTITLNANFANFPLGGFVLDGLRGKPVGSDKIKFQGTSNQNNGLLVIGTAGTTIIGVDFTGAAGNGLQITSSGNTIDSCLVNNMGYQGITIAENANDNTIKNSLIYNNNQTSLTGAGHEHAGIYSLGGGTVIDSCYIYGNNANGILLRDLASAGAANSEIKNSVIGRDENGTESGNGWNGIFVWGADGCLTEQNIIVNNGFTPLADWSRVSGVRYQEVTSGTISLNYIGTDAAKTNAGNDFDGITLHTNVSNVSISENVICYNGFGTSGAGKGGGVALRVGVTGINITSNFIGAHADSTAGGNHEYGVSIEGCTNNTIGGANASDGNVIGNSVLASKGKGIWMSFAGTTNNGIYNNLIVGNTKAGIEFQAGASNNIVGADGQGNTITGNGYGVYLTGSNVDNNTMRYNSFACNTLAGIRLQSSANDNYGNVGTPKGIIINESEIRADFISGFAPSANATVDIYAADNLCAVDCDNSVAQGMTMVATVTAAATASSNGLFAWEYDFVAGGNLVNKNTAIVLATENGTAGQVNTSEFSICAILCNTPTNALIGVDDADICTGDATTLAAISEDKSTDEDYSYTWYLGSIDPSNIVHYAINDSLYSITQEGNYIVMISSQMDSVSCKDTSNLQAITVTDHPEVTLPIDTNLCYLRGDQIDITAVVDTVDAGNLVWSTTEADVLTITVGDTLEFIATFTDVNGCIGADTIKVANMCTPPDPQGPNVVTENSPWTPIGELTPDQFVSSEFIVYDRWGLKMFDTEAVLPVWKGEKNNGRSCPSGVYFWIWKYTDIMGEEKTFNGFVQLLKQP